MSPFALGYDLDVTRWTLEEVAERGTLVFECRRCRRMAVLERGQLEGRFNHQSRVAEVRRVMRCRRCGSKFPEALVRLKIGRGDLAWWPLPPRLGR
jgi:hypothetical protein